MLEHVLNLLLRLLEIEWAKLVDWPMDGWSIVLQFNLELMSHPYWRQSWREICGKDVLVLL